MGRKGFTLIELLVVVTLITAALGMIWQVWLNAGHTQAVLGKKITVTQSTAHGMARIRHELRGAARHSLSPLPAAELRFRVVVEGAEWPLDEQGQPRLSEEHHITPDWDDRNQDGLRARQLVLIAGDDVEVLSNHLAEGDGESGGVWFDGGEDTVLVHLRARESTRRGIVLESVAIETIAPRNP